MIHIIANPAAQSGTGKNRIHDLLKRMKKEQLEGILHLTTHPGHAGELAGQLSLSEKDTLVLVGGDGSLDELINGLPLPSPAPMVLLPAGSGNDFARGMKLSHDPTDVIERLCSADRFGELDLGLLEIPSCDDAPAWKHRFAVSCGIGMDAAICEALETGKLKRICNRLGVGKLSYLVKGIQTLLRTGKEKRARLTLTLDDETILHFQQVAFLSVHNLPYEGGGFPFCPGATAKDGLLDLCVVNVPNRLLLIPILLANLMGGRHAVFRHMARNYQCRKAVIELDRPLTLHTDGEVHAPQTCFTVTALPAVLRYLGE